MRACRVRVSTSPEAPAIADDELAVARARAVSPFEPGQWAVCVRGVPAWLWVPLVSDWWSTDGVRVAVQ